MILKEPSRDEQGLREARSAAPSPGLVGNDRRFSASKTRFAMVIRHEVVVMASVHQNCPGEGPTPNTVPVTKAPRLRKKNSGLLIPNNISAMIPT